MNKRKIIDLIKQFFIYLSSSLTLLIFVVIFGFIFVKGKNNLNFKMLRQDYWSKNIIIQYETNDFQAMTDEVSIGNSQSYSKKFGVVLEDFVNHENKKQVIFKKIYESSAFNFGYDASIKDGTKVSIAPKIGDQIERMILIDQNGDKLQTGMIYGHTAHEITEYLDQAQKIDSLYLKTPGGGIWGSIKTTLMLIGLSLLFALPLGIFSAIYLTEIASKNKLTQLIQTSIDLLAGVPSIIFGLMGVVVLYPVTAFFKVKGLSILLGSMTMSVVLLPVIIRSVQESLKLVPNSLRMASLSLGATDTITIFRVVLPSALSGILSATLLAISRIIGESAALIYTMGTYINDHPKVNTGGTSLSVHIWSIMSSDQPNFELASAISILILFIVLVMNLFVKFISLRFHKKVGG